MTVLLCLGLVVLALGSFLDALYFCSLMCSHHLFILFLRSPPPLTFCCPVLHGLSDWNGDWDAPKIWGFIQSEKLAAQQPCKLLLRMLALALPRLLLDLLLLFCLSTLDIFELVLVLAVFVASFIVPIAFTGCFRKCISRGLTLQVLPDSLRGSVCESLEWKKNNPVFPCSSSGCWTITRQQRA